MITRILPPEEWPRLAGTEVEALWPQFDPARTRVVVVEDAGEIVATWTLLQVVHAECVWIRPSHRARYSVVARLLRGMWSVAEAWGATRVVTGSVSPEVTDLIQRLGGTPMPCESFVLPVRSQVSDVDRGRQFHEQLEAQIAHDNHAEDATHDAAVGRALKTAIHYGDPAGAVADYNAWAQSAGYAPIEYLGSVAGRLRVDIRTAIVEIDHSYAVRVIAEEATPCQQ